MALVKPPKSTDERRIEKLIDGAAAVHTEKPATASQEKEEVPITVRIPVAMLRDIERMVRQRPIKTPRHTWLMEALYEKWKRETRAK